MDDEEPMLVVSVKADGSFYMNVGQEDVTLTLKEVRTSAAKIISTRPDIKVLVEGDKSLPYGRIVDLMNALQLAGARSVGLITEPPAN